LAFLIERNDITLMEVDVIVNAANIYLKAGGGVCGAIFNAAGKEKLQKECEKLGNCDTGSAVITKGYNLKAKHIIHAVGPVWEGGKSKEDEFLSNAYLNSLKLAKEYNCESIAFPLISTGVYNFPKERAFSIAKEVITGFLNDNEMTVYLVIYDNLSLKVSKSLLGDIKEYIDDNYVDEHHLSRESMRMPYPSSANMFEESSDLEIIENQSQFLDYSAESIAETPKPKKHKKSLEDVVGRLDETFSQMLLRLIDEKDMTDAQAYKQANIDRRLFSKIRSNTDYSPSKATALAFAISLELNMDQTKDLLRKAGFALSHSNKFDLIIEYFIINDIYDIFEINEALFTFKQAILGK